VMDPQREERELRAYLGDAYDHERLVHYDRQLEDELEAIGDEETLYRTSEAYLYNLTAFAMTRTKEPYLNVLRAAVPPGSKVLDYGCGIGSDGLALIEAGYDVEFADFDNPSTRYLRWRLEQRGRDARIYDLDREQPPGDFDVAYSFDVIEHVPDPFAFVERLEACARMVLVNFLEPIAGETDLHHDLPVRELVRHAAARRLLRYEVFHGRSHLVLYDRRPGGRVRAKIALVRGGRRRP
jgi:SAM-dependent methyltransferase